MRRGKFIKAILAAVVSVLLVAPLTDFAGQPEAADTPLQNASSSNAAVQAVQSVQPAGTPLKVSYQYDSLGRLINESYPANTVAHGYDAAGNRTQSSIQ